MPTVSIVFIRWSLIQLGILSTLGSILLISKATGEYSWWWQFRAIHSEGMWIGWILNLVLGTAWWIMPKRLDFPDKYGFGWIAWLSFGFAQVDWLYRIFIDANVAPIFIRLTPFFAMLCFVIGIWPRLKYMIHEH
jgi:hypothetical protein